MYDAIEYRGYGQEIVEVLAKYSGVPVWNGLTDTDHPTQVLADFLTMEEHIDKPLEEMQLTFVGDLSDQSSCMLLCMAVPSWVCTLRLWDRRRQSVTEGAGSIAEAGGTKVAAVIEISHDPEDVKGSDVIYTDVWVSMGEPEEIYPARVKALSPFKITEKMMRDTATISACSCTVCRHIITLTRWCPRICGTVWVWISARWRMRCSAQNIRLSLMRRRTGCTPSRQ